jgi:HEAT repeat protein
MMGHRAEVAILVREDLANGSPQERRWALKVAGALKLNALYDEVEAAFRGPEPEAAAYALRDLDDPRAIPVLIQSSADHPTMHFEILRSLQRHRPANGSLLELVRSTDATVRWQAAYALAESRDSAVAPVVERLAEDPMAEVRRQAGLMASLLHEADYRRVHPAIVLLLSDPEIAVRSDVAIAMAQRGDRACAAALLQLLRQEQSLEPWRHSNIVQAIHTLTGNYFGLTPGTPSSAGVREKALTEFGEWIKKQGAP